MSVITSSDTRTKESGETRNVLVSFVDCLDKDTSIDETISSVSSVAATGLTISNAAVTTVVRKYREQSSPAVEHHIPAGKGITFTVAGGTNGQDYSIKCTVVTSGSQTIVRYLPLQVRAS